MTCKEFANLTTKCAVKNELGIDALTNAEFAAWGHHAESCPTCLPLLAQRLDALGYPGSTEAALRYAAARLKKVLADPEASAVLNGNR